MHSRLELHALQSSYFLKRSIVKQFLFMRLFFTSTGACYSVFTKTWSLFIQSTKFLDAFHDAFFPNTLPLQLYST